MSYAYDIPAGLIAVMGGAAAWDALTPAHGLPGSFGLLVRTNLDATVSSRATQAQILSDATPFAGANIDATISSRATQADILDDATPFSGADIAVIRAKTDGLAELTETGGTLTTDGNEQNLYINNAPAGVYRPICLSVDFTNHTATETVVIKVYSRIRPGGNMILKDTKTFIGTAELTTIKLIDIDLKPNRYGIQITIQKTVGTNRAYDWEVSYEAV